jgi:hypothetical protein
MGAKNSKSANITTASPKKEALPVEGENHVNGDAGNKGDIIKDGNGTNHVIEVSKEEVKEIVKELAQEAAKEVKEKEDAKEKDIQKVEEKENTSPTPAGKESPEEKPEKKKVTKKFSLRRLSFLRKEKKVKEDKHKNGDVTSPEKKDEATKEEEVPKVAEEGQGDAAKAVVEEAKPEEKNEEVKEEEKKVEEKPVVVEKVEEPVVVEEPKKEEVKTDLKTEVLAGLTDAMQKMELTSDTVTIKEVCESVVEKKFESISESKSETIVVTNSVKENGSDIVAATENGIGEPHSEEIVAQ